MGFYHPSTLVKDAQRHGLKIKPIDITCSDWLCTLTKDEPEGEVQLRMGLRYVRGLREQVASALLDQRALRPFSSITDLARRVPELNRRELATLADIGALNSLAADSLGPSSPELELQNSFKSCLFIVAMHSGRPKPPRKQWARYSHQ